MKIYISHALLLFLACWASLVQAGDCDQSYTVGSPVQDSWSNTCLSEHYLGYDPYNPQSYFAKYFAFNLERDADIAFSVTGYGRLYLMQGTNKAASPMLYSNNGELKAHLQAGNYILEYASAYYDSFTLISRFNDVGDSECLRNITSGVPVSDGWVPQCTSQSRDVADPYSPVPDEGHRAKYFTFTLNQDSDISINVESEVSPYIYILDGDTQFGTIQQELSSASGNIYLVAGTYTIELTTRNQYDPGQFVIAFNVLNSSSECRLPLNFGGSINGTWSPACEIVSWIGGSDDPYAGRSPERAKYYTFDLDEASDVRFTLPAGNDNATILNLYNAGSYETVVATTRPTSYWSSNARVISQRLAAGSYELEVTQYDQTAIGNFTVESQLLSNDCSIGMAFTGALVSADARLSDNCTTDFRGIDGIYDPYGVQEGTYYAKRFEFTLSETTALRISASGSQYSYLYLAKKSDIDNFLITESYQEDYYSATTSPVITRELAPGTYVAEVTSFYPERSYDVRLTLSQVYSVCDLSLNLNEYKSSRLETGCLSEQKDSVPNPDPYGYPSRFNYYAKRLTFEISAAGTYQISMNSSGYGGHIYLLRGGDKKGELVDDFYTYSAGDLSRDFTLTAGIYTLEVTSAEDNQTGSFDVLVWDKETNLSSVCQQDIQLTANAASYDGALLSQCTGSQRGSNYHYKHYDFSVVAGVDLEAEITVAEYDTYLYLLKQVNDVWVPVTSDDDGGNGSLSKISTVLAGGNYRLEVTSYSPMIAQGPFVLRVKGVLQVDSDGDGVADDIDAFPDDPSESVDSDGDGVGNNADTFPYDASESTDSDGDGVGDNSDAFALNRYEFIDSDGDGIGDVADQDDDNDGIPDLVDANRLDDQIGRTVELFSVSGEIAAREGQTLSLNLTRTSTDAREYRYYTYDGTAVAGYDYVPAVGTLTFAQGVLSETLTVTLLGDDAPEGNESLSLVIFPAYSGSNTIPQVVELTIQDDLPTNIVRFEQNRYLVREQDNTLDVSIIRSGDLSVPQSYVFSTMDATARAMEDYLPVSGRVDFLPGESIKVIHISLIVDQEVEAEEHFMLTMMDVSHSLQDISTRISFASESGADDAVMYSFNSTDLNDIQRDQLTGHRITLKRTGGLDNAAVVNFNVNRFFNGALSESSAVAEFAAGEDTAYVDLPYDPVYWSDSFASEQLQFELVSAVPEGVLAESVTWTLPPRIGYSGNGLVFSNGSTGLSIPENLSSKIVLIRPFLRGEQNITLASSDYRPDLPSLTEKIQKQITLTNDVNVHVLDVTPVDDNRYQGYHGFDLLIDGRYFNVDIDDREDWGDKGALIFSSAEINVTEDEAKAGFIIQRLYGDVGEIDAVLTTRDGTAVSGVNYIAREENIHLANSEVLSPQIVELVNDGKEVDGLYFYVDLLVQLGEGRSSKATLKVNIIDSGLKEAKSSDSSGGHLTFMWILALLFPLLAVRRWK